MNLGGPEILVILVVALLVFGPTRLPEVGKQLGKAIRELRKIENHVKSEISAAFELNEEPQPANESAPYYGDPTNVPDTETPIEREAVRDSHDEPLPIDLDDPTPPKPPATS